MIVLYTDGVIERRQESIDEGFERLRVVGDELADLEPEDFSDALLEALVPGRGADRRRRPPRRPLRRPRPSRDPHPPFCRHSVTVFVTLTPAQPRPPRSAGAPTRSS